MSMSKIWTVRGVSDDIQRRAAEAANAAGMRLGPWVERALRAGLERSVPDGAPSVPGDLAAQLAALVERVERLEAGAGATAPTRPSRNAAEPVRRARKPAKTKTRPEPSGGAGSRSNQAIPDDHLAEADRLNREDISFAKIIETKGWSYNRSSLAKAVSRWRKSRS
jgi:hypothetical protein